MGVRLLLWIRVVPRAGEKWADMKRVWKVKIVRQQ